MKFFNKITIDILETGKIHLKIEEKKSTILSITNLFKE